MKPVDDIGTCVERGKFRFRPGSFQEQAPRPRHKLGLKELEKQLKELKERRLFLQSSLALVSPSL